MPSAMADQPRSTIIEDNPIGNGLDTFRASFSTVSIDRSTSRVPDALGQLDQEALRKFIRAFLRAAQNLPAADLLPASTRRGSLRSDLLRLELSLDSDDFDLDRIKPVLNAALADHLDDTLIWGRVYDAVTESTPPPRPIASSLQQTPWLRNTSSFANSSEHREYVDNVLKEELGPMYVGLQDFYKTYFGDVPNLETASETFFRQNCLGGSNPLFCNGWRGWPEEAKQDDVLSWFADFTEKLAAFAESCNSAPAHKRRPLAKPDQPIAGSVGKRKMDIGFVDDPSAGKDSRCHWSQILVPGELKSNPSADRHSEARLDLGRYAREVLAAQDNRRFVLGFTLCGSLMRIWVFDRLGGIASEQFDINKDRLRFGELGFDPTITTAKGERFIEIIRGGSTERLVLDETMKRARCIAGRATTCWKAYRQDDPHTLFVVKDSWQYLEREEEGEFLSEATDKGVVHVARHYHHETVRVQGMDDDVRGNVRQGLDVTKATNYWQNRSRRSPSTNTEGPSRVGRSSSIAGPKRSSHETGAFLPPSKRPCSTSPTKAGRDVLPNRVHRRVILSDWGIPIYKAGSRAALLAALADCIEGHESLRQKAGLLHRDISIGNLMVSKDNGGFFIDLDLARVSASGAKGKTGTRAFMAIGALLGEQHSFMHDLESFFWVLFWICIHCDGPGEGKVVAEFDKWNYANTEELAKLKLGTVSDEVIFRKTMEEFFTEYYQPLLPWVNKLRKAVFPAGGRWKREDSGLYTRMREILGEAYSVGVAG
ncbi:hypothetical protein N658DRAFT_519472 [Parathielavia hyrcaniae]|uniref:non-specific serine/threonine protein kinase n=1 Tax=Parathielavia hyrcaniae TaxID=113614 RepID=A0AAN6SWU1_9PEZI|nr:hypothetical protein N658DRAFT_519472 [Parathielavia hyrcaniae]